MAHKQNQSEIVNPKSVMNSSLALLLLPDFLAQRLGCLYEARKVAIRR